MEQKTPSTPTESRRSNPTPRSGKQTTETAPPPRRGARRGGLGIVVTPPKGWNSETETYKRIHGKMEQIMMARTSEELLELQKELRKIVDGVRGQKELDRRPGLADKVHSVLRLDYHDMSAMSEMDKVLPYYRRSSRRRLQMVNDPNQGGTSADAVTDMPDEVGIDEEDEEKEETNVGIDEGDEEKEETRYDDNKREGSAHNPVVAEQSAVSDVAEPKGAPPSDSTLKAVQDGSTKQTDAKKTTVESKDEDVSARILATLQGMHAHLQRLGSMPTSVSTTDKEIQTELNEQYDAEVQHVPASQGISQGSVATNDYKYTPAEELNTAGTTQGRGIDYDITNFLANGGGGGGGSGGGGGGVSNVAAGATDAQARAHMRKMSLDALKRDISCLYTAFSPLIPALRTPERRKKYEMDMASSDRARVEKCYLNLNDTIREYYTNTQLKVGVITAEGGGGGGGLPGMTGNQGFHSRNMKGAGTWEYLAPERAQQNVMRGGINFDRAIETKPLNRHDAMPQPAHLPKFRARPEHPYPQLYFDPPPLTKYLPVPRGPATKLPYWKVTDEDTTWH